MKIINIFTFLINLSLGLNFGSNKINFLDKSHVKNYADNWIHIWREKPYPLSDLRINEAWKSIVWCSQNKYKDNFHCLNFNMNEYFVLVYEDVEEKSLKIVGLLESPDNKYYSNQIKDLHNELLYLSNTNNYKLDFSLMKNWSHGFYFYEYH